MNLNHYATISIDESLNRGEFLRNAIEGCTKDYIFFTSEKNDIAAERELIESMISKCWKWKADMVIPADSGQTLPELIPTIAYPLMDFQRYFTYSPFLNGKLFRTSALKALIASETALFESLFPDFLIFHRLSSAKAVNVEPLFDDHMTPHMMQTWRQEKHYLRKTMPSIELERSILYFEYFGIQSAVRCNMSSDEIRNVFDAVSVAYCFQKKYPERLRRFSFPREEGAFRKVKKIGVFYPTISKGGTERVISLFLQEFAKDFTITFFQMKPERPDEFPCPKNVRRITLPGYFFDRLSMERQYLHDLEIDTCICFEHLCDYAAYDILLAKSMGIRVVSSFHSVFFSFYYLSEPELCNLTRIAYSASDLLTCLSRSEEYFWGLLNIRSRYIPNPLTFKSDTVIPHHLTEKNLIFIGRLTQEKGVFDAIRMLALVKEHHPDIRLTMCGDFIDESSRMQIQDMIRNLKLECLIQIVGFTSDIGKYLSSASVLIIPSVVEGWGMTLFEARAHGIPAVVYSMPYLETTRPEYGCISVEHGNYTEMAKAVSSLFDDFGKLNDTGRLAKESLVHFSNDGVFKRWIAVFQYLETGHEPEILAIPEYSAEEKLNFLLIYGNETVQGIDFMLSSLSYRKKQEESVKKSLMQKSLFLHYALKLDGSFPSVCNRIAWGIVKVFLPLKKLYRNFIPWRDS